jgi:prophage DNA circulation protein
MLYTHAVAAIGGAVLAGALAWNVQGWRLGNELNGLKAKHAAESAQSQADTRAKELAFNQKLQDAQNEATKRETKLRADADTARRTADGLRGTLYEFRASLPNASTSALIARADTAAELLGTCVNEYRSVAEAADRHAGDALMLQEAWPK